ncbi:spinster family MFS transporter [Parvularcula dongshanensis]|uniref:MFS family permease n=1 Tax=Parvularcula dongshanensis TaxID=1173995 RepID=A0A840I5E7_9PROT|nr:MFS transporter [Parvularcula dongshanensis]MBB4659612.1 MFS family permease [Parvularcula dongshanensis]
MSDAPAASLTPAPRASNRTRAWVLAVLVIVYTFNFIDRQIVGILAVPIKAELGLSDTQIGLMSGLAFALFYTLLGVPIAMLADRKSRVVIMTVALTVWSAMTAACGLAQSFGQLFLARLGVGVGEAGGVAPAYSLIADYFPPQERSRALAVYSFGIPVGSAIGIILGGILASLLDWRAAFFIVGGAGLLAAPLLKLTVREPVRGGFDKDVPPPASDVWTSIKDVVATLARKPSFWGLSLGAASASMMGYGLFLWLPSFFVRSFGEALPGFFSFMPDALLPPNPGPLLYAAYFYGAILLIGGVVGIWMGGALADRYGQTRRSAYAVVPACAFVLTVPFLAIGLLTPSLGVAFVVFLIPTALGLVWLGPVISAFQHLVPPHMRATASAVFLFVNNLIGIGVGQAAIGAISDGLTARLGAESLRYAILSGCSFYVIAAVLMFVTAPRLRKDWHEAG